MTAETCPITAIFPAHERIGPAVRTLQTLLACNPRPAEIIVHVDGGNENLVNALTGTWAGVRILSSDHLIGPGGARNRLLREASHELVANFDDDSFPQQHDYFARVLADFEKFPNMAVLSASSHQKEREVPDFQRVGVFSGCGCVYRRSWFLKTHGFVPLPIAYGMEEVDLSLQLHALGATIILDPQLCVIHDRVPSTSPDAATHAAILVNTMLFPYLRYPKWLWPLGAWHLTRRLAQSLRLGWWKGLGSGLRRIPSAIRQHRAYRHPMPFSAILSWKWLRRNPMVVAAPRRETSAVKS